MSTYKDFVKKHYADVLHLAPKERFKALGQMWRAKKEAGGRFDVRRQGPRQPPLPRKRVVGELINAGSGSEAEGAGFLSDALDAFGLGLKMKRKAGAVPVPPSVPVDRQYSPMTAPFTPHESQVQKRRVAGGGIFSDIADELGLGLKMKKGKRQAKAHGGGFLSDALGSIGLGLPPRMRDKKLGTKFTKAQRDKIHAHVAKAHGAGFADMFLKGIRLPFDGISKIPIIKDIPILKQATQIIPTVADLAGVKSLI